MAQENIKAILAIAIPVAASQALATDAELDNFYRVPNPTVNRKKRPKLKSAAGRKAGLMCDRLPFVMGS